MSSNRDLRRLTDMRTHAAEAIGLIEGKQRADLDCDRVLSLALVRLMEIVGEAAARLSDHLTDHYPDVPWPAIVSLRNRLIHGYDAIDLDILWQVLATDLPALLPRLDAIIAEQQRA
jgi:uncharacterized protein with HEPN domain